MPRKKQDDKGAQAPLVFQQPQVPDLFRKAVPAIHIAPKTGSLSLQQRKMFSSLIKNAIRQHTEEKGRTSFEITLGALSQDVDLNSNNTDYVKETINSLLATVVNWDHLNQDGARRAVWKASSLLAGAELDRSVLRYSFSDQLRPELLNPEKYAMIDMRITRQFRKSHSLALWENMVRYEGVGITARMQLGVFRDLILGQDAAAQSYQEYKHFKSRVLTPCVREVNEVSDHIFELIEHKAGRSVEAIQFRVTRKPDTVVSTEQQIADATVLAEMVKLSVPRSEARRLLSQFGEDRVRAALAYTRARMVQKNAPPVGNTAAYFRKALSQEYAGPAQASQVEAADASTKKTRASKDAVKDRYLAAKISEAKGYFKELEIDDQTTLIGRYNETVDQRLQVSATKHPTKLAETSFYQWLVVDTWGEPTPSDLLEFVLGEQQAAAAV